MTILIDREIAELAEKGMIDPFEGKQISDGVISYGLSSFGYDARVGRKWSVFKNPEKGGVVIDPKNFNPNLVMEFEDDYCILPPNGFALAHTIETFDLPSNIFSICMGKSTYARCGLVVNVTPLEPGWRGEVTLEFSNTTPLPIKIYSGEGVCQFLFFRSDRVPSVTYSDRKGKYQNQRGITLPK